MSAAQLYIDKGIEKIFSGTLWEVSPYSVTLPDHTEAIVVAKAFGPALPATYGRLTVIGLAHYVASGRTVGERHQHLLDGYLRHHPHMPQRCAVFAIGGVGIEPEFTPNYLTPERLTGEDALAAAAVTVRDAEASDRSDDLLGNRPNARQRIMETVDLREACGGLFVDSALQQALAETLSQS